MSPARTAREGRRRRPAPLPAPDRRTVMVIVGAIVALVVLYVGLVSPMKSSRDGARRDLATAQRDLAAADEELATVRAGDTVSAADLTAASAAASRLLPGTPRGADDVAALWREAEKRGLRVVSFSAGAPPRTSAADGRLQVVDAQVNVAGPLTALVGWLTALRNDEGLVVTSVGPLAASGDGVSTVVAVSMYSTTTPTLEDQLLAKRR